MSFIVCIGMYTELLKILYYNAEYIYVRYVLKYVVIQFLHNHTLYNVSLSIHSYILHILLIDSSFFIHWGDYF